MSLCLSYVPCAPILPPMSTMHFYAPDMILSSSYVSYVPQSLHATLLLYPSNAPMFRIPLCPTVSALCSCIPSILTLLCSPVPRCPSFTPVSFLYLLCPDVPAMVPVVSFLCPLFPCPYAPAMPYCLLLRLLEPHAVYSITLMPLLCSLCTSLCP